MLQESNLPGCHKTSEGPCNCFPNRFSSHLGTTGCCQYGQRELENYNEIEDGIPNHWFDDRRMIYVMSWFRLIWLHCHLSLQRMIMDDCPSWIPKLKSQRARALADGIGLLETMNNHHLCCVWSVWPVPLLVADPIFYTTRTIMKAGYISKLVTWCLNNYKCKYLAVLWKPFRMIGTSMGVPEL